MSDKIDKLSERIKKAKLIRRDAPENIEQGIDPETAREMSMGMRLGIELLAGIITGALIGYFFDYIFNTMPLFLIIFLLLGAAAGFWTVYKLAITGKGDK
jgi:ATP synthase protein I